MLPGQTCKADPLESRAGDRFFEAFLVDAQAIRDELADRGLDRLFDRRRRERFLIYGSFVVGVAAGCAFLISTGLLQFLISRLDK